MKENLTKRIFLAEKTLGQAHEKGIKQKGNKSCANTSKEDIERLKVERMQRKLYHTRKLCVRTMKKFKTQEIQKLTRKLKVDPPNPTAIHALEALKGASLDDTADFILGKYLQSKKEEIPENGIELPVFNSNLKLLECFTRKKVQEEVEKIVEPFL